MEGCTFSAGAGHMPVPPLPLEIRLTPLAFASCTTWLAACVTPLAFGAPLLKICVAPLAFGVCTTWLEVCVAPLAFDVYTSLLELCVAPLACGTSTTLPDICVTPLDLGSCTWPLAPCFMLCFTPLARGACTPWLGVCITPLAPGTPLCVTPLAFGTCTSTLGVCATLLAFGACTSKTLFDPSSSLSAVWLVRNRSKSLTASSPVDGGSGEPGSNCMLFCCSSSLGGDSGSNCMPFSFCSPRSRVWLARKSSRLLCSCFATPCKSGIASAAANCFCPCAAASGAPAGKACASLVPSNAACSETLPPSAGKSSMSNSSDASRSYSLPSYLASARPTSSRTRNSKCFSSISSRKPSSVASATVKRS
mmetsp:Transcript_14190/g.40793  ORF Transcript_14190/g.40793 Transcript_14190/m.40793 type:complete len:364 (-) Transcript_14190:671-1762(-)